MLNKQIVDTQGMKVVRVNDIKFSMSGENQLRLLGAEVGARGLLRAISPTLEHVVEGFMKPGKPLSEDIIAWSYMDLLDRSTKNIQLSVSHKTLGELHPADIADIIEQLDRACVRRCSRSSTPPRPPRPSRSSMTTSL
ncbi:MAG: hypothetical protein ACLU0O_02260 [Collinsella sp.]